MVIHQSDEEAIKALWQRAIDALEDSDWQAYETVWAHESHAQAIHPATGSWWTGWQEIGPRYRRIIEKGVPIRGSTRRMDMHVGPGGHVGWAAIESEVKTGKTGQRLAWQVVVFQKTDGEWRMVLAFDAPRRGSG